MTAPTADGCYFCGACVDVVRGERARSNNCAEPAEILLGDGPDMDFSRIQTFAGESRRPRRSHHRRHQPRHRDIASGQAAVHRRRQRRTRHSCAGTQRREDLRTPADRHGPVRNHYLRNVHRRALRTKPQRRLPDPQHHVAVIPVENPFPATVGRPLWSPTSRFAVSMSAGRDKPVPYGTRRRPRGAELVHAQRDQCRAAQVPRHAADPVGAGLVPARAGR